MELVRWLNEEMLFCNKPGNMISIPVTHVKVERRSNSTKLSSGLHMLIVPCVPSIQSISPNHATTICEIQAASRSSHNSW